MAINLIGRSQCSSGSKSLWLMICLKPVGLWFPDRAFYLGVRGTCVPFLTTSMCGQRWLWRMSWCHLVLLFWNCTFLEPCTSLPLSCKTGLFTLLPQALCIDCFHCLKVWFWRSHVYKSSLYCHIMNQEKKSFYKDVFIFIWLQTEKTSYEYVKEFFEILRKGSWGL